MWMFFCTVKWTRVVTMRSLGCDLKRIACVECMNQGHCFRKWYKQMILDTMPVTISVSWKLTKCWLSLDLMLHVQVHYQPACNTVCNLHLWLCWFSSQLLTLHRWQCWSIAKKLTFTLFWTTIKLRSWVEQKTKTRYCFGCNACRCDNSCVQLAPSVRLHALELWQWWSFDAIWKWYQLDNARTIATASEVYEGNWVSGLCFC